MKFPITITDKKGFRMEYANLADAECSVEPMDVLANEYSARDALGNDLKFIIAEKGALVFGLIKGNVEVVQIVE